MALLNFPTSPVNGQLFPVNPPPGTNVYQWSSIDQTWRLAKIGGVSTGGLTFLDDISSQFNGSRFSFNLSISGEPASPDSNLLVFVGGVAQVGGLGASYVVANSTITFTSPPPSGASFVGVTVV